MKLSTLSPRTLVRYLKLLYPIHQYGIDFNLIWSIFTVTFPTVRKSLCRAILPSFREGGSKFRIHWRSIHMAKISSRKTSHQKVTIRKSNWTLGKIFGKILGKIFWPCELTSRLFDASHRSYPRHGGDRVLHREGGRE